MLVLSRRLGEKLHIGSDVVLTVVEICRDKIRLGIDAPRDLPIYRQELLPLDGGRNNVPCPKGEMMPHGEVKRLRDGLLRIAARCGDWSEDDTIANVADLLGFSVASLRDELLGANDPRRRITQ